MRRAPLLPASSSCHVASAPQASGDTIPTPVTTIRLIRMSRFDRRRVEPSHANWSRAVSLDKTSPPKKTRPLARSSRSLRRQDPSRMQRPRRPARPSNRTVPTNAERSGGSGARRRISALRVLLEKLDGVAHGENRLGGIVRNLAPEFLLEGHHQFDRVEAIGAKVVDEARVLCHLVGLDPE